MKVSLSLVKLELMIALSINGSHAILQSQLTAKYHRLKHRKLFKSDTACKTRTKCN